MKLWSKLEKRDAFIDAVFTVKLMNATNTSIKIMSTLDMLNFKEFPEKTSASTNLEICDDYGDNNANKIYMAFFCHQNEISLVEFELTQRNSTHAPLKFYMKKFCNRGKIPELNVLMTTNKTRSENKDYEYQIIDKSVLTEAEDLPIVLADQVYFYISSEIGKQILIYPKIIINDTDVKGYLTGRGTFG